MSKKSVKVTKEKTAPKLNPWVRKTGSAKSLFGFLRTKSVFTRPQLMEYAMKNLGLTEKQAMGQIACVLSPSSS